MLNLKNLEHTGKEIKENLEKRGFILDLDFLNETQIKIKKLREKIAHNNHLKKNNRDVEIGKQIKADGELYQNELNDLERAFNTYAVTIPNVVENEVPIGKGEEHNTVCKVAQAYATNEIYNSFKAIRQEIDTETGALLAGARFTVLRGQAAKLHRHLINEALDFYGAKNYEEVYVPNLVLPEVMFGTGQYPKFKEDLFLADKHYLIPTGEVPMTNMYRDKIVDLKTIKDGIKLMTHTPCFRKEAGAYGKDTKGLMRQHQFEKVELVKIVHPEQAKNEFFLMLQDVEDFVLKLGINYRIVELCTGDMGFAGHKAFDIELFFAEENRFREIASITWCGDFQARRMNTKFKEDGKTHLVHTINGTGLAVGRILEAIVQKNS